MSKLSKTILALLLTYLASRLLYLISGFSPTQHFGFLIGLTLDFTIWLAVYSIIYWVLGKFPNQEKATE
jgi:hypothetical protein